MPLRMMIPALSAAGFECIFLGASVPTAHLQRYLERTRPVALAVSCSVALHLDGVRACADAAHEALVPLLAGGAALGDDGTRAQTTGADAWAESPAKPADLLAEWRRKQPTELATPRVDQAVPVLRRAELCVIADDTVDLLRRQIGALTDSEDPRWARTREDIDLIVRFAVAALRFRDATIFDDFTAWLRATLVSRGLLADVIGDSYRAIADSLPSRHGSVAELIRAFAVHKDA